MSISFSELRLDLAAALAQFLPPEEASAESLRWFEDGLDWSRAKLAAHGQDPVPTLVRRQVGQWLRQRREGVPWAYLVGFAPFRGRRFQVSRDTLIPRPETELTLEAALEAGRRLGVERACDIGTGTGILGISLALETGWAVTASDLSPRALEVARRNAAKHRAKLSFVQGDLLEPVPAPLGLVVSNPPYVDPADAPTLQRELAFEPAMALFAADGGLALSTAILAQARERGAAAVVLEIGAGQGGELSKRARDAGWAAIAVKEDWVGHDRVLVAER